MTSCLRLASQNLSRSSHVFSTFKPTVARRYIHQRKELPYSIEEGLGKFLPPPALGTLLEYQEGLLERLNQEVRTDTRIEPHSSVTATVIKYAQQRDKILAFNYAVLALNNSFFLEQLAPTPPEESGYTSWQNHISDDLFEKIRLSYGDLLRLKSTFSSAAMGMFTNGWVWFVSDIDGNLGVIHTLGPSTLLVRSRANMHYDPQANIIGEVEHGHTFTLDTPIRPLPSLNHNPPPGVAPSFPGSGTSSLNPHNPFDPHARSFSLSHALRQEFPKVNSIHAQSPNDADHNASRMDILGIGKMLFPLFVVPVYEHAWMSAGFGVWGKEAWLKEFWSVLDWRKVNKAYAKVIAEKGALKARST